MTDNILTFPKIKSKSKLPVSEAISRVLDVSIKQNVDTLDKDQSSRLDQITDMNVLSKLINAKTSAVVAKDKNGGMYFICLGDGGIKDYISMHAEAIQILTTHLFQVGEE